MQINHIHPTIVKQIMDSGKKITLLDVRTIEEFSLGHIANSIHIPLAELQERLSEIPKDSHIIAYCHHGTRSTQAAAFLRLNGYIADNLEGGIDAWAETIEPTMPRY